MTDSAFPALASFLQRFATPDDCAAWTAELGFHRDDCKYVVEQDFISRVATKSEAPGEVVGHPSHHYGAASSGASASAPALNGVHLDEQTG